MRYSIIGATVEQVRSVGGAAIKAAPRAGIIFANLTPEQANRLRAMGCRVSEVAKVQAPVRAAVYPPSPILAAPLYTPGQVIELTGFDKARAVTSPPLYGSGVNLALIDSGIRETHVDIAGHVVYSKNYTSDPMEDDFNHGTSVCSVALAVAPQCSILNLKILDKNGEGSDENVVLAIDDCIGLWDAQSQYAPSVINLSVGALDDGDPNNPMRVACRAAIARNIWVVAACGNSGPVAGTITSPACEKDVFAIGSAEYLPDQNSFVVSDFSSRGPTKEGLVKPDVIMFGENLLMDSSQSDTATVAKSGTSFAAPFCSGIAVLIFESWKRRVVVTQPITVTGAPLQIIWPFSPETALDNYIPPVCIKPQGVAAGKDDDYGYGLPLGTLIMQTLGLVSTVDISSIISPMMGIFALGMLGMMMVPMVKSAVR